MPEAREGLTPEQFEARLQEREVGYLGVAVPARLAIMHAEAEEQLPLAREWMALELDDTRNYIIGPFAFFQGEPEGITEELKKLFEKERSNALKRLRFYQEDPLFQDTIFQEMIGGIIEKISSSNWGNRTDVEKAGKALRSLSRNFRQKFSTEEAEGRYREWKRNQGLPK